MNNYNNPNLVALAVNISRAYEIAKYGNHTVNIIPGENCSKRDIPLLMAFYGFAYVDNPDITIELMYSPEDVLNCFTEQRHENLQQIKERLAKIDLVEVSDKIDTTCMLLLKTATKRLMLSVNDLLAIFRLAKTIAQLAECKTIKVEHIAEAIQYRSIPDGIQ